MKLILENSNFFRESINIISELVTEATFWIRKEYIELIAMDPGNVSMVVLHLISNAFSQYDVEEDKAISLNLTYLKQILKRAGANDVLILELIDDSRLQIVMRGKTTRTFVVPLINLENEEKKVPQLKFPVSVQMPSSLFKNAIEDAAIVSDAVSLITTKDKMVIEAKGDLSSAKTEIKNSDGATIVIDNTEDPSVNEFKAKYSIEYLKKMINGDKIAEDIILRYNSGYPLKIEYNDLDKVSLSFILAPRVDE